MKLFSLILLLFSIAAPAQQIYVGPSTDADVKWAREEDLPSDRVPFCRGYYKSDRMEANGSGYWTDMPGADINFLIRLAELTNIRTGKPVVVRLDSPLLLRCPVLYMSDVGTIALTDAEVLGLRTYLLKGGFLWVDDFWGPAAWEQWVREIRKVLPTQHMRPIPNEHPVFHAVYSLKGGIWQMPTTGIWMWGTERITSERGDDSVAPEIHGLFDLDGQLLVLMTFNTDVADGWEAAEQDQNIEYFAAFSHKSYALGVNVWTYALTH